MALHPAPGTVLVTEVTDGRMVSGIIVVGELGEDIARGVVHETGPGGHVTWQAGEVVFYKRDCGY